MSLDIICSPMHAFRSHIASLVHIHRAMYSASVVDDAGEGCFLLNQEIYALLIVKMIPENDFLWSMSSAKSESQYPVICNCCCHLNVMPWLIVPFRYFSILFVEVQCAGLGFSMYWLTLLTACAFCHKEEGSY